MTGDRMFTRNDNQQNDTSSGFDAGRTERPAPTGGQRGRARVENLVFVLALAAILATAALVG